DVKTQAGIGEPMRDGNPLSAAGPFSALKDFLGGLAADWGAFKAGCNPNSATEPLMFAEGKTRGPGTVPPALTVDQLLSDIKAITDSGRKKIWTAVQMGLSVLRNLRPEGVPAGLTPWKVAKIMDGHTGGRLGFSTKKRHDWRILFIGGMWFQDLF